MRLILFDIDNTLLKSPKSHNLAFVKALSEVFQQPFALEDVKRGNTPGTTDPEILLFALKHKGVPQEEIKKKWPHCLQRVVAFFSSLIEKEDLITLPGVSELLPALKSQGNILGLVTGNLEPIAWLKLKKAGIAHYFSFGAFGSDNKDRNILTQLALKRAERYSQKIPLSSVYLVGDTTRDVMAGKKAGIKTIAVATGNVDRKTLENTGADLVLDNLANVQTILDWI
ncbi:MAG: HAD hydrolase-like protein [Candidatus Desulfofervidaceae bacterium]|nr:HAD hydrolase-like protein [Candidatus Desulfofervidaceae bacterium]MDL1969426.1 HAD hydrolase-like protein [Candidatus Desulfofervidaceae bacterium]